VTSTYAITYTLCWIPISSRVSQYFR